jgi:hypothetical protein
MRGHERIPTRSLHIQGPASVLDRFVAYANELKADAYWEVLDKLLSEKGSDAKFLAKKGGDSIP